MTHSKPLVNHCQVDNDCPPHHCFRCAVQMGVRPRWFMQVWKDLSLSLTWGDEEYSFMGHWWCWQ